MIIGLLALAYVLFGGGNETFLLNPNLKKNVDTYVADKNRKMEIDQIIKQVGKSQASFQKETKKVYDKKLVELNMNRASTSSDFKLEYDSFYIDLKGLQNGYLDSELKMRSIIRLGEWDSIMNKVLQQPDKEKVRKNILGENKKLHDRLLSACEKRIPDSAGKEKAKRLVDGYEVKGDTLAYAFLNLNYRYIETLRPYNVTRQDFEPMRAEMIELRRNFTDYLIDMRFKMMEITPEKEWEGLAKELNNNFTYMGAGISK
jgi:hypothetical protein